MSSLTVSSSARAAMGRIAAEAATAAAEAVKNWVLSNGPSKDIEVRTAACRCKHSEHHSSKGKQGLGFADETHHSLTRSTPTQLRLPRRGISQGDHVSLFMREPNAPTRSIRVAQMLAIRNQQSAGRASRRQTTFKDTCHQQVASTAVSPSACFMSPRVSHVSLRRSLRTNRRRSRYRRMCVSIQRVARARNSK